MKCVMCRNGVTHPGFDTVTLTRQDTTVIFKNVPAEICDVCGEYYLDDATAASIQAKAVRAQQEGALVEILRYAA